MLFRSYVVVKACRSFSRRFWNRPPPLRPLAALHSITHYCFPTTSLLTYSYFWQPPVYRGASLPEGRGRSCSTAASPHELWDD